MDSLRATHKDKDTHTYHISTATLVHSCVRAEDPLAHRWVVWHTLCLGPIKDVDRLQGKGCNGGQHSERADTL